MHLARSRVLALLAASACVTVGVISAAPTAFAADKGYKCTLVDGTGTAVQNVFGYNCEPLGGAPEAGRTEQGSLETEETSSGDSKEVVKDGLLVQSTLTGESFHCVKTAADSSYIFGTDCQLSKQAS
ncbi:Secreted protein [Nocardia ninae]|uniref:Secreted protein n=1 Tax=Nocardia ninae NBRC 108245 TaxID=1210091 RepID=A0A511MK44_9NOCA|nr:hypothetical protein NN4_48050 [Nocardia ninae NBRC 108245]